MVVLQRDAADVGVDGGGRRRHRAHPEDDVGEEAAHRPRRLVRVRRLREANGSVNDDNDRFAAGIMLSASFWSLLNPALELAQKSAWFGGVPCVPVALGFLLGAGFVHLADWALKDYRFEPVVRAEHEPTTPDALRPEIDKFVKSRAQTQWRRTVLMSVARVVFRSAAKLIAFLCSVVAITAHNVRQCSSGCCWRSCCG